MARVWPANDSFTEGADPYGEVLRGYLSWVPDSGAYQHGIPYQITAVAPRWSLTSRDPSANDDWPVGQVRREVFGANCRVSMTAQVTSVFGGVTSDRHYRNGVVARCRNGTLANDGEPWVGYEDGDCYAFYVVRTGTNLVRFRLSRYNTGTETILKQSDELTLGPTSFVLAFTLRLEVSTDVLNRVSLKGVAEGFSFTVASVVGSNIYPATAGPGAYVGGSFQGGHYNIKPQREGGIGSSGFSMLEAVDTSGSRILADGRCGYFADHDRTYPGSVFATTQLAEFSVDALDQGVTVWRDEGARVAPAARRNVEDLFNLLGGDMGSDWWNDAGGQNWWDANKNLLVATQAFDNVLWIKTGVTVGANADGGPSGVGNADRLTGTGTAHVIHQDVPASKVVNGRRYIGQVKLKKDTTNQTIVRIEEVGGTRFTQMLVDFDGAGIGTKGTVTTGGTGVHGSDLASDANGYFLAEVSIDGVGGNAVRLEITPSSSGTGAVFADEAGIAQQPSLTAWAAPFYGEEYAMRRDAGNDRIEFSHIGGVAGSLHCWSQRVADNIRSQHRRITVQFSSVTPVGQRVGIMLRGFGDQNLNAHLYYMLTVEPGADGVAALRLFRRNNGFSDIELANKTSGFAINAATNYTIALNTYSLDGPTVDGPPVLQVYLNGALQVLSDVNGTLLFQTDGTMTDPSAGAILTGTMEGIRIVHPGGGTYSIYVDAWTQLALNLEGTKKQDYATIPFRKESDGAFGTLALTPAWVVSRSDQTAPVVRHRYSDATSSALATGTDTRSRYQIRKTVVGPNGGEDEDVRSLQQFWKDHKGFVYGFLWAPPGQRTPTLHKFRRDSLTVEKIKNAPDYQSTMNATWAITAEIDAILEAPNA